MLRRFAAIASSLAIVLSLLPGISRALPPSPELDQWNEGPPPVRMPGETIPDFIDRWRTWRQAQQNRLEWNCYNYAVDAMTTQGGNAVRAHPGKGVAWPNIGANLTAQQWCDKCRARAKQDGLHDVAWNPGDAIPTPPPGENLVALGAQAGFKADTTGAGDYHWWRLNGDGSWSHKRGGTKAKTTYTDNTGAEQPLTDPRNANQRDGYTLCGFMSVPKSGANVGPLASAATCTPSDGLVLAREVGPSGLPDPQKVLSNVDVSQLAALLPVFSPGTQVPDPQWQNLPAGQSAGFEVMAGADGMGPIPPYLRAYQGTLEVTVADTVPPAFYSDVHGIESFLYRTVVDQPTEACDTPGGTIVTTPCTCSDEALGNSPTATLLALFQAEPVAEGLELHWQFGDASQYASVELDRAESPDGPWTLSSAERRDEGAVTVVVDRSVVAGRTYFYRLVATAKSGAVQTFGPISGTAGVAIADDMIGAVAPNPSKGAVRFDFTLRRQTYARISVLDVQGREIAVLATGPAGPGHFLASWSGETARGMAPAGFYVVRLQLPGRTLSRQFIVTR